MKKLLFIILLCFIVVIAGFTMDMSPQPGDTLEMVLNIQDNVVMGQAKNVPAVNVLHFDSIYNYEICMATNDEWIDYIRKSGTNVDITVSYIGYKMGTANINTVESITVYKTEFG